MEVHPESREKTSLIFIEPAILRKMAKFKKKYKKMIEEIQASLPWFQIFRMKQQKKLMTQEDRQKGFSTYETTQMLLQTSFDSCFVN